jgi:hypothetical protein
MNSKPDKLLPAVYGGVVMALLSSVPVLNFINCFCCAGILLGGMSAVFFYKNAFTPDTEPYTTADCLVVGAMAGVVGAVLGTLLSAAFVLVFGDVMRTMLREMILNSNLDIPSDSRDRLESLLGDERVSALVYVVKFFSNLFFDTLFGLLGGLIGYAVWKPKTPDLTPMPRPQ